MGRLAKKIHALVVSEIVRCFRALVKTAIAEACHPRSICAAASASISRSTSLHRRTTLCDAQRQSTDQGEVRPDRASRAGDDFLDLCAKAGRGGHGGAS